MVLTPLASSHSIKTPLTYPPAAAEEYYQKVLSYNPIAHFPIWDPLGSGVAEELVNSPAQDGAHTAVTLGQPGIGDGRTSGWYDGATSFTNIWSAAFQGAFNGLEGTAKVWMRVANAGTWTDGLARRCLALIADGDNSIFLSKLTTNNTLWARYRAGGVNKYVTIAGQSFTDFRAFGITWSGPSADDEVRVYLAGVQQGLTQTGLGAWAGGLTTAVIGANSLVPTFPHHGWEAHAVVFDYAMPPAGMLDLATI